MSTAKMMSELDLLIRDLKALTKPLRDLPERALERIAQRLTTIADDAEELVEVVGALHFAADTVPDAKEHVAGAIEALEAYRDDLKTMACGDH